METAIVFLPLIAAILAGFGASILRVRGAQWVTCLAMVAAMLCSWILLVRQVSGGEDYVKELYTWFDVGRFSFSWAVRVDMLSVVMFVVVTTVSSVVHIYSVGYMHGDPCEPRFMAYLSLFSFFMLALVSADNLVQMFFGWEGVGLASYLLIGFWHQRPAASAAAIKAFLVNRVGDVGFALGIFGLFLFTDSVAFDEVLSQGPALAAQTIDLFGYQAPALTTLCLLLFLGAMGKSAQLGLHTWLPDAMEGPTPVSALIHAATMVTAGVFMVCRLSPLFEYSDVARDVVVWVGGLTAFFAATVALTQNDIKRVIAYSTCSQLGYMFFAAGLSAYGAAMFHLFTHAFFKALLFLGAGSVIHAMSNEQDMRKMGGLSRMIPGTYFLMWIGSLALAGIGIPGFVGFAGFHSKDTIIEVAWLSSGTLTGQFAFLVGVSVALLTAFYSWRLLFMTFHGLPRCDEKTLAHVHESPTVMMAPLLLLAAGSIAAGFVFAYPMVGDGRFEFWGHAISVLPEHDQLSRIHDVPLWVALSPLVVSVVGILFAWIFYLRTPGVPVALARLFKPLYLFLLNKWYFDELYEVLFQKPAFLIGRLFSSTDRVGIDRFGPDGFAGQTLRTSRFASALQTGFLYHYAFAMLVGAVLLISWILYVL